MRRLCQDSNCATTTPDVPRARSLRHKTGEYISTQGHSLPAVPENVHYGNVSSVRAVQRFSHPDPFQPSGRVLSTTWSADHRDYVAVVGRPPSDLSADAYPRRPLTEGRDRAFPSVNSKVRFYKEQKATNAKYESMLKELNVKWEKRRAEFMPQTNKTKEREAPSPYVTLKERYGSKVLTSNRTTNVTDSVQIKALRFGSDRNSSSIDVAQKSRRSTPIPVYRESRTYRGRGETGFTEASKARTGGPVFHRKPTYSDDYSFAGDSGWLGTDLMTPTLHDTSAKADERINCAGATECRSSESSSQPHDLGQVGEHSATSGGSSGGPPQTAYQSIPTGGFAEESPFQYPGYYPGSYYGSSEGSEGTRSSGEGLVQGSSLVADSSGAAADRLYPGAGPKPPPLPVPTGGVVPLPPATFPVNGKGGYIPTPVVPLPPQPIFPPIGGGGTKSGYIGNPYFGGGGKFGGGYPKKVKGEFQGWVYPGGGGGFDGGYPSKKGFGGFGYLKDKWYRYKQKLKMIALYPFYKKWQWYNSLKSSFYGMGYGKGYGGFDGFGGGGGWGGKGYGGFDGFDFGGYPGFGGKGYGFGGGKGSGFGGKGYGFGGKGYGGFGGGKGYGGKSFGSYPGPSFGGGFPVSKGFGETFQVSGKLKVKPKSGYSYP